MYLTVLASLAMAQATPAAPVDTGIAHVSRLDAELAQQEYNALNVALLAPANEVQARQNLDWLGQKFKEGRTPFVAFTYARILLAITAKLPPERTEQLRATALSALIYAITAARVEGLQCADGTARGNRAEQLTAHLQTSGLLSLPQELREQAALVALTIERDTWKSRRVRDDAKFECANGMEAMTAGLALGQARERARQPGEIGRQFTVQAPADFVYRRRPDAEWWIDAEKARANLPNLVRSLARL